MNEGRAPVAILRVADGSSLSGLSLPRGFPSYYRTDRGPALALLGEAASMTGSRVVVAVGKGALVEGYLCALPPRSEDVLAPVESAIELVAFEVDEPIRGKGVFTAMFDAAFRDALEEHIVYVNADPDLRGKGESVRDFRRRLASVFGALGFAPAPAAERTGARHDPTTFVRLGRGVDPLDVTLFYGLLRSGTRDGATKQEAHSG